MRSDVAVGMLRVIASLWLTLGSFVRSLLCGEDPADMAQKGLPTSARQTLSRGSPRPRSAAADG